MSEAVQHSSFVSLPTASGKKRTLTRCYVSTRKTDGRVGVVGGRIIRGIGNTNGGGDGDDADGAMQTEHAVDRARSRSFRRFGLEKASLTCVDPLPPPRPSHGLFTTAPALFGTSLKRYG